MSQLYHICHPTCCLLVDPSSSATDSGIFALSDAEAGSPESVNSRVSLPRQEALSEIERFLIGEGLEAEEGGESEGIGMEELFDLLLDGREDEEVKKGSEVGGSMDGDFGKENDPISKKKKRIARWRSLLAGLIAGPSMLLTGPGTQHNSLAIYILMHAAVLASRCGIKSKQFRNIRKPLTWSHGDIFLVCVKEVVNHTAFTNLEGIEKCYKSVGVDLKLDPNMKVPCLMSTTNMLIMHGNQSCVGHFVSFLFQAYGRAVHTYLCSNLFSSYTFFAPPYGSSKCLHPSQCRPYTIPGKSLLGTARSSMFLSMFYVSAWAWTCLLFRIFQSCNTPLVILAMDAGVSVLGTTSSLVKSWKAGNFTKGLDWSKIRMKTTVLELTALEILFSDIRKGGGPFEY
ncbi:hypothetical protein ABZP36_015237 [Zizania latifolia]